MRLILWFLLALGLTRAAEAQAFADAPPVIEILEKPNGTYPTNGTILYKVRLHFPAATTESLRLKPPMMELENLEFLGVSQETTTSGSRESGFEQILTFRFRPLKAGAGGVRVINLSWHHEDGSAGPSLRIPEAPLNIRAPLPSYLKWLSAGLFLFFGGLSAAAFFIRKKKKSAVTAPREKTLEETVLAQLAALREEIKSKNSAAFLDQLRKVAEAYLAQKLDWNGPREGYNTLFQKAEHEWAKKDAQALGEFFEQLEHFRFSGEVISERDLTALHQTIYSLIEKKQTF